MTNIQKNAQLVANTIQTLNITAEYDTMNKLLGCLEALGNIIKEAAQLEKMIEDTKAPAASEDPQVEIVEVPADAVANE